jgi:hypothetical protein
MLNVMAVGSVVLSMFMSPAAAVSPAQSPFDNPPQDKIVIDVVTVNGSGCKAGTAAVAVSADNTAFTVTYSDYIAQIGGDAKTSDFRKNCQLNLRVHVPGGFTYAIAEADFRGYAQLAKGATGQERANYYFQGSPETLYTTHPFKGPYDNDWAATDSLDVASLVFKPCGEERNLNVNTELKLSAGTSDPKKTPSLMSMDSTDGSISTVYHFAWKTCPKK